MGRSVSTHRHSVSTVFLHPEFGTDDVYFDFDWREFVDDVKAVLQHKYPSLCECDRWQDREDHVILENSQVEISVSEYCGLVAVCLAPRDPDNAFHVAIAERMAKGFEKTLHKVFPKSALKRIGGFSNGESVYERVTV